MHCWGSLFNVNFEECGLAAGNVRLLFTDGVNRARAKRALRATLSKFKYGHGKLGADRRSWDLQWQGLQAIDKMMSTEKHGKKPPLEILFPCRK